MMATTQRITATDALPPTYSVSKYKEDMEQALLLTQYRFINHLNKQHLILQLFVPFLPPPPPRGLYLHIHT